MSEDFAGLVERLEAAAWAWGQGCEVDGISDRTTIGDSYNEGQRDDTKAAGLAILQRLLALEQALEAMTASRDRTRAALEKMRASLTLTPDKKEPGA